MFDRMNPRNMVEFERKILKADLHGCIIKVTRSKCVSLVGREGIVLQETKNAFLVITSANELKSEKFIFLF